MIIGKEHTHDLDLELPLEDLTRHLMVLGATGSGKTYLAKKVLEEAARSGVDVIAIDTQGDVSSLCKGAHEAGFMVRLWSVGDDSGHQMALPLPLELDDPTNYLEARFREDAERRILSVLGMKPRYARVMSDLQTAYPDLSLVQLCELVLKDEGFPRDLPAQTIMVEAMTDASDLFLFKLKCQSFVNKPESFLYRGEPLNLDQLLHGETSWMGTVHVIRVDASLEDNDKSLIVESISSEIVRWMYRHRSGSVLRALFFLDEAAPYVPPSNRKTPPCKESLMRLFRQARKYGVGLIVATQSPGDIDYKAFDQFGTWFVGRITAQTAQKKVKSAVPGNVTDLGRLPPHRFICVRNGEATRFKAYELLTDHGLMFEDEVREWRQKNESLG